MCVRVTGKRVREVCVAQLYRSPHETDHSTTALLQTSHIPCSPWSGLDRKRPLEEYQVAAGTVVSWRV